MSKELLCESIQENQIVMYCLVRNLPWWQKLSMHSSPEKTLEPSPLTLSPLQASTTFFFLSTKLFTSVSSLLMTSTSFLVFSSSTKDWESWSLYSPRTSLVTLNLIFRKDACLFRWISCLRLLWMYPAMTTQQTKVKPKSRAGNFMMEDATEPDPEPVRLSRALQSGVQFIKSYLSQILAPPTRRAMWHCVKSKLCLFSSKPTEIEV